MINPQFPGQYGQTGSPLGQAVSSSGQQMEGQQQPLPASGIYNGGGQIIAPGATQFPAGLPLKPGVPVQNGPGSGPSSAGPQAGDVQFGTRFPTAGQNRMSGLGPVSPHMPTQTRQQRPGMPQQRVTQPSSQAQISNQMAAMNIGGQQQLPKSGNPPGPMYYGMAPSGPPPGPSVPMGGTEPSPVSRPMGALPTSMEPSPTSLQLAGGQMPPPSVMGGGPPTNMRIATGTPTSMALGGATSMGMGRAPPTSMGMGGMPPIDMGISGSSSASLAGVPTTSMGYGQNPQTCMQTGNQPPPGAGYGMPSMRQQSPGYAQPPPTGFPQHGGMPPSSQFGGHQGMQQTQSSQSYVGGGAPMGPPYSGYTGVPGQRPGGQGTQPALAVQPPQKKLDPDQMPSPIQVIEDDRKNRSGIFQTTGRGIVPPLVTTDFITQDQGNCNPAFMRCTMYNVPCTVDMLKNSNIPLALTVSPFAKLHPQENPPPVVNLGEFGPVRCKRCKAYMNPYMMFIDGGRRFQCVFCGAATDVPSDYFAHLDHTGRRTDCYSRPELCLGSYEFVATKDYCKDGVMPSAPAFIFMIDVSYNSVKNGLVSVICQRLKQDILLHLPKEIDAEESEIRVGFVTYAKEIHFYNVKGSLAQPQMLVVSDLEDVFVPLLDGFLVKLSESEAVIDSLLSQIPQMFAESRETEVVLGPVIQAGLDALKSSDRAGKLYIFHTSLPVCEAPGKLKNRDDRKLLGTDKEKTVLSPQTNFYTKLGQECVAAGCSVDMFLFPNAYIDVASIGEVCRLTGGYMYKYSYFQGDIDGDRFIEDLRKNVESQSAFDAILRVRTSQGIRPVDFLGNMYMANTTDVELAAVDANQGITVEIKHDDKLNETEGAYIQVAVLFTSVGGQRRLRIHNLSLNCCTQLADLFRSCELDTFINYMAKHAIRNVLNKTPKETREHIMNQVAQVLACYRKNCASPSSAGQLILPECMKLLPLYSNCVIKNDGIQGGSDISTDDRSYLMHLINGMDVKSSSAFFYPQLVSVHDLDVDSKEVPLAIRCSAERLLEDGVYLLENGVSMFMWIGHNVDPEWIQKVFGVQSAAQVDIDKCQLLDLDNPTSHRLREVISEIRHSRPRYMKLTIVRQRDKLEPWFNHFLVEDKGQNGSASYVDFLCYIHKEIRNLLS